MALEGKYLQKLQVNIQDIYNQVIKENEEKQEIHDQKVIFSPSTVYSACSLKYPNTHHTIRLIK